MRKLFYGLLGLVVITVGFFASGSIQEAKAGPHISINIPLPPPPPFLFPSPPEVIVVPRSQVVIAPHPEVDIFFYDDYWWSPRGDRWFRSRHYNGPWHIISLHYVPAHIRGVPRDYRTVYEREPRYPYENHDRWMKQRKQERIERREWRERRKEYKHDRGRGRGRGND
ncbi:MAG: hypothetical protein EHM30_08410 [Desulfobacteraceae bacterium]|nr:MAG: hypothetical protein EHM30_08410 [Desulfobacteraceae bacterium]